MAPEETALLIIEDDEDVREVILESLESLSAEKLLVTNAQEGLEVLFKREVSAVLTDINMPKISGLDFLRETRRRGIVTPVMFLSAYGDKSNILEALRLGAFDFIDKPFDLSHLEFTVRRCLHYGELLKKMRTQAVTLAGSREDFLQCWNALLGLRYGL